MTIVKCQARNPATCVDPQCPLEKHKEAETKSTQDKVTTVSKKFAFARTPQDFEAVGNEYQATLMDYDSSRGGIKALQTEYDSTPDSDFTKKDILFARLESAKERYDAKYGDPQGAAAKAYREVNKGSKVVAKKAAKFTAEDIKNGWTPEYPEDHPANHPFEREERSFALLKQEKENHVNYVKDFLAKPHTYKVPVVTIIEKNGNKTVKGEKATPGYEAPSSVTKKVRQDIKEAVAAGYLPKGVKYSVKIAAGSGYNVYIQGLDDSQIYSKTETNQYGDAKQTPEIKELVGRVEKIMSAYNSTLVFGGMNRDQPRYYAYASVEDERSAKWRAQR